MKHRWKIGSAIVVLVGIIIFFFCPTLDNDRPQDIAKAKAVANAQATELALRLYSQDHKGDLPKSLQDLVPVYLANNRAFENIQFMTPGMNLGKLPRQAVMLQTASPVNGRSIIIRANGSCEFQDR